MANSTCHLDWAKGGPGGWEDVPSRRVCEGVCAGERRLNGVRKGTLPSAGGGLDRTRGTGRICSVLQPGDPLSPARGQGPPALRISRACWECHRRLAEGRPWDLSASTVAREPIPTINLLSHVSPRINPHAAHVRNTPSGPDPPAPGHSDATRSPSPAAGRRGGSSSPSGQVFVPFEEAA